MVAVVELYECARLIGHVTIVFLSELANIEVGLGNGWFC